MTTPNDKAPEADAVPQQSAFVGAPINLTIADAATVRGESRTKVAGSQLVPDLRGRAKRAGVTRQYRYWVGVTPDCPVEAIDLAGINFPKLNEEIVRDPLRTDDTRRVPVIGAIVFLTEDKIRRMRERLPRTVIRFYPSAEPQKEEPGTGMNIGDVHQRPRRGQLITIPSEADIQARRAAGRPAREYVPSEFDVPAANFMFAVLCTDQTRGNRGDRYPEVLANTGLEWPDELSDLEDLLT